MRLHIEGRHTKLEPHLVGKIAEQLDDLNTPHEDIFEASVIIIRHKRCEAARIQLLLAGITLQVTQRATTPDAAVNAALLKVQDALHDIRAARSRTPAAARTVKRSVRSSLLRAAKAGPSRSTAVLQRATG
jgi:ribosome-associated translation inhibitor RaiA